MSILTQPEGMVLGVGAKMFLIAGPVIVYGVAAGVLYGLIIWLFGLY
ncbi:SpoVA/SpoVAEb family sporulation membrane protein [Faecalicatena sp. BF-R-105]|nr:SpoVA/SpoVAEb family sporulation membrane protein [Faecalicatena sp. BF-R-105]